MELFTERLKLKDIILELEESEQKDIQKKYKYIKELSGAIAKEYDLKEDEIEFIRKNNPLDLKDIQIEDGERAAIRYINTADVDRDSEIVMPDGLQTKDFEKSKTVLYAHNYQGLPIGRDLWLKLIKGKGWLAKTLYASHLLANDVYNLVKDKFLNTSSIGFIPLESIKPDSKKWDKVKEKLISEWGIKEKLIDGVKRIYTKSLLLEHSDVPIPSNINALNIAVGKGLKIESKELIDDLELEITDKPDEVEDEEKEPESMLFQGFKKLTDGETIDKEKEVVLKPEETDEYIRIPVKGEEGKHSGHRIRTITISAKEGIKALYCGECKKAITFLFDKTKWDMARAKKWMADHGKNISGYYEGMEEATLESMEKEDTTVEDIENVIKDIAKVGEEKEEDKINSNESINYVKDKIEKLERKKSLLKVELEYAGNVVKELREKIEEFELKAGAVLNKKNKADLTKIKELAQNVLDSAETAEPAEEGKQAFNCECLKCGHKLTSDKHCNTLKCPKCGGDMRRAERPGPGKEADVLEIEEPGGLEIEDKKVEEKTNNGIDIDTLKSALKDFFEKYQEENKKQDIELYSIINEKLPEIADIFYKKIKGKVM